MKLVSGIMPIYFFLANLDSFSEMKLDVKNNYPNQKDDPGNCL